MKASIRFAATFEREYKALRKKFPSIVEDVAGLVEELEDNPRTGTPLGRNAYKIRLKISSKGKGKSGGGRVISLVDAVALLEGETETPAKVTLLSSLRQE